VAPPVFKTGLAAIAVAGGFDSLPPPPIYQGGRSENAVAVRSVRRYSA
jgi:hypothetical protein